MVEVAIASRLDQEGTDRTNAEAERANPVVGQLLDHQGNMAVTIAGAQAQAEAAEARTEAAEARTEAAEAGRRAEREGREAVEAQLEEANARIREFEAMQAQRGAAVVPAAESPAAEAEVPGFGARAVGLDHVTAGERRERPLLGRGFLGRREDVGGAGGEADAGNGPKMSTLRLAKGCGTDEV